MPVNYHARGGHSSERTYQIFMDWTRKLMQLAALATILLYGYVLYGLIFGVVGDWGPQLPVSERARIAQNINGALLYLNVALGALLLTLSILYYEEEPLGYTLVAGSILFYYGIPFLVDIAMPGKLANWENTKNIAALAIFQQFKIAAIMMAVPGVILLLRDVILRVADGAQRKNERMSGMQYGGSVKEEAPVGTAIIGVAAKCWQLPFCREPIRKRCPIYHARTRCWKERVGCMCEENVIRHAMDAIINREVMKIEQPAAVSATVERKPDISDILIEGLGTPSGEPEPEPEPETEKTESYPRPEIKVDRKKVRIPYNEKLPMSMKRERCRNCVIYNEHQRLKYQFVAPLVVLAVPGLAYLKIDILVNTLNGALRAVDQVMARLSLEQGAKATGIAQSLTSSSVLAEWVIIGCIIIIVTTWALRFLEYCIFKLKI